MKRFIITLAALLTLVTSASAMSYKSARDEALFLSDKMAYELNLTEDQYNAVFEINLDYIMCIDKYSDLSGIFWERRNTELGYVLTNAQYHAYMSMPYFYRPISWTKGKYVFVIYNRYPRGHYYHSAPAGYEVYRGANRYYDHSPYKGRTFGAPATKSQPAGHIAKPASPKRGMGKSQPGNHYPVNKKTAVKEGKQRMDNTRRR